MDTDSGTRSRLPRQLLTFAIIGGASTVAYAGLYLLFREVGSAQASNAAALLVTAVGNTAANRRFTFGVQGRATVLRDQLAGLLAFGLALAITTASVGVLRLAVPAAGRLLELSVLVLANLAATASRFALLCSWIGRAPRRSPSFQSSERIPS